MDVDPDTYTMLTPGICHSPAFSFNRQIIVSAQLPENGNIFKGVFDNISYSFIISSVVLMALLFAFLLKMNFLQAAFEVYRMALLLLGKILVLKLTNAALKSR